MKLINIHLGKNPVNGGNPPIESKFIIKNIFNDLLKKNEENN